MTDNLANRRLKAGKLPPELLASFLGELGPPAKRILLGPGVGEDAAFISFGSSTLIAKSDPITFATDRIGWYAVQVNANDIAASGGTPKWFLATLLLPENEPASTAKEIFGQLQRAADELGIALIGGHTEITVGLPRPIISGTMLGEAAPSETLKTASATPGDDIILTAGIAIEGTAIIARESTAELLNAGLSEADIARAADYLDTPGISVVNAARVAAGKGYVTAMHDPTEGGLAGALDEMARASGTGITVDAERVTVLPETSRICNALKLDPWGLLASGALLITTNPEGTGDIITALADKGIPASVIGKITGPGDGLQRVVNRVTGPLPRFDRDEIARFYGA
ncbi:MAG: AIR synthase family protein [Dehalococcoidia bacterium]|jgi:hydrogenase maturation factor|nr:AIR synthase family protein [Dehalococcoidia bacterium]